MIKLDYSDVMIVPQPSIINSRSEVVLFNPPSLRIIAANMDGVGTFDMAIELAKYNIHTALVKHYPLNELVQHYQNVNTAQQYSIYSMGIGDEEIAKLLDFSNRMCYNHSYFPVMVCIDVANGYCEKFLQVIAKIRKQFHAVVIMAGNVCTPEGTKAIINAGADYVKIGIGPGAMCTTRIQTGVGYPQFSAVLECAAAAKDLGAGIVADGGITCPGDAAKAFCAGADAVMIGSMFAGHDEGLSDDTVFVPQLITFYGMASKAAQTIHNGGVADYRSSEGREVMIPYRGPVSVTVKNLLGGLSSTCAYVGAHGLDELKYKAEFIQVNHQVNTSMGV